MVGALSAQLEKVITSEQRSSVRQWLAIAEEEARGTISRDLLERIVNDTLYRLGHSPVETPTAREFFERWLVGKLRSGRAADSLAL
jgi:hypothetical protein